MQDRLVKISFSTADLQRMPKTHSAFFVASSLAINEIMLSLRLFLMTLNSVDQLGKDDPIQVYAFSQFQMTERTLGAKVVEYLNMLNAYQKTCQRLKDTLMLPMIKAAMDHVRSNIRTGPYYELAVWYRNTASFHYLVSPIGELINSASPTDEHEIYLHQGAGNANYLIGEQILLLKLAELGHIPTVLREYGEWVKDAASYAVGIHHDFTVALFRAYFPHKTGQEFEIDVDQKLVAIPHETSMPVILDLSLSGLDE